MWDSLIIPSKTEEDFDEPLNLMFYQGNLIDFILHYTTPYYHVSLQSVKSTIKTGLAGAFMYLNFGPSFYKTSRECYLLQPVQSGPLVQVNVKMSRGASKNTYLVT